MSSPVTPEDVAAAVPSVNGSLCERFLKALLIPNLFYQFINWFLNAKGEPSQDFIDSWCAQSPCTGGGGTGTGLAAPVVDATDGAFADKVQINWTTVSGATLYDLYRHTVNDPGSATLLAADLTAQSYDDDSVTPQVYYYYWVKAKNATQTSPFSQVDRGYAGTIATTLPMITDLTASQGFNNNKISLVWTPAVGADSYDIYRNTSNDFNTASLIDVGRAPFNNAEKLTTGPTPTFVDNGGELVYIHDPGQPTANRFTSFYFWVIARRAGPPAQSPPSNNSNGAQGWANGWGDGVVGLSSASIASATSVSTPGGASKVWIALYGGGAGGAGGDASVGGGGGGGAAMIRGWISVASGSKLRVSSTPEAPTSNAATGQNGSAGPVTIIEYSALGDFTDAVTVATCNAAAGGTYNGAGGAGADATNGTLNASLVYEGRDGKDTNGTKGGRSGCRFGNVRQPGAHFITTYASDGTTGGSGGGSYAVPTSAAVATGGKGYPGFAYVVFRT